MNKKRNVVFISAIVCAIAIAAFTTQQYVSAAGGTIWRVSRISRISRVNCVPSGNTGFMYCDFTY
jgi:hypothetical protein